MSEGFSTFEHTGDLGLEVWAERPELTAHSLKGSLVGPRRDRERHVFLREVKAVSHHALELDPTPGTCRCRLILDI